MISKTQRTPSGGPIQNIDNIRGLAVIAVLLFHTGIPHFKNGYLGVDIFFVISGVVIHNRYFSDPTAFKFREFYLNRIIRLIPSLLIISSVSFMLLNFISLPNESVRNSSELLATFLGIPNIYFYFHSDYFSGLTDYDPYIHHWSLGVEEQFYVFFPFLFIRWLRFKSGLIKIALPIFVMFMSISWCIYFQNSFPARAFYLLPGRILEFFLGVLLSLFLPFRKTTKFGHIAITCIWLTLAGLLTIGFNEWAIIQKILILFSVILLIINENTTEPKLISKIFKVIGISSYSIYLIHQPLYVLYRMHSLSRVDSLSYAVLVFVSIASGILFTLLIESKIRYSKVNRTKLLAIITASLVLTIFLHSVNILNSGSFARVKPVSLQLNIKEEMRQYKSGKCFLTSNEIAKHFDKTCLRSGEQGNKILVWGDSHAASIGSGLARLDPNVSFLATGSCTPGFSSQYREYCLTRNLEVLKTIILSKPKTILLEADWQNNIDQATANLPGVISRIKATSPGSQVIIIGPLPIWNPSLNQMISRKRLPIGEKISLLVSDPRTLDTTEKKLEIISNQVGVKYLSLTKRACHEDVCPAILFYEGKYVPTVYDYVHLTWGGSEFYSRIILNSLSTDKPR